MMYGPLVANEGAEHQLHSAYKFLTVFDDSESMKEEAEPFAQGRWRCRRRDEVATRSMALPTLHASPAQNGKRVRAQYDRPIIFFLALHFRLTFASLVKRDSLLTFVFHSFVAQHHFHVL